MDMSHYREMFLSEAKEHFRKMSRIVLAAEGGGIDPEALNALFRETHSVKGMAASMGYARMEALAHHLESAFDALRRTGRVSAEEGERLLAGLDLLEGLLRDIEAGAPEREIASYLAGGAATPPGAAQEGGGDEGGHRFRRDDALQSVRVQTPVLDRFIDLAGELITSRYRLQSALQARDWDALQRLVQAQGRLIGDLHHQVRQVRLMPLESLTGRLPRLVRDMARRSGKEVRLHIDGEGVELDRAILEALADPLVHLVRNAVDHGIARSGTVSVRGRRQKDQVVLEVADDGRGIDAEEVLRKALQRNLVDAAVAPSLGRRQIHRLICAPGLSTAADLTVTSGRGIGMDVVRSAVEGVGGRLEIDSREGEGTCFRMYLPLSAAIIHLLLVECGAQRFGIPFTRVQRIVDVEPSRVLRRPGKGSRFVLGEEELPLVCLARILGLAPSRRSAGALPVIVTEMRGRRVGLAVGRTAGSRQAFVKGLAFPLDGLRGVSGSTVLGDGGIVFVIDPHTLLERSYRAAPEAPRSALLTFGGQL